MAIHIIAVRNNYLAWSYQMITSFSWKEARAYPMIHNPSESTVSSVLCVADLPFPLSDWEQVVPQQK